MSFRKILTTAVGVPENASDDEIARAMAELLRPQSQSAQTFADDPQGLFTKLATEYSRINGVSMGEAYSAISREAPTLLERATIAARLN